MPQSDKSRVVNIDLVFDKDFISVYIFRGYPCTTMNHYHWVDRKRVRQLFQACRRLGLDIMPSRTSRPGTGRRLKHYHANYYFW
jgi:hypothetical protein